MIGRRVFSGAGLVVPVLIVIAFVTIEILHVAPMSTVGNIDYFPMVDRALQLSLRAWDGWVSWKHPVGQSLAIRVGYDLGFDVIRVGQAWAIVGGLLALCGTWLVARSVFDERHLATIALAFTASSSVVLLYSSIEGNDAMAAGLQSLALGGLALFLGRRADRRLVWWSGVSTGLAYLFRYNGMVTAMACGVTLVVAALMERKLDAWKVVGLYVGGFLLGAAIQWVPSLIVAGNPFLNDQGQNVWFHVFGKTDYFREWQQAPSNVTVWQVFITDPRHFITFWWGWFSGFWIKPELTFLDAPLKLFGQAGLAFMLIAPGSASGRVRGLLGWYVVGHLASISMMRLHERFLFILIPLLTIGAVYLLAAMLPPRWEWRRLAVPVRTAVLCVGLVWMGQVPASFVRWPATPSQTGIKVSNILHSAGMRSAADVLSTHPYLQDASSRARLRFVQAYAATPEFKSLNELYQAMRANQWRFLVYHRDEGPKMYPSLDQLSPYQCPEGMSPVFVHEAGTFSVCRLNEPGPGYKSFDGRLANGALLQGVESYLSRDFPEGAGQRLGVYLYWRAQDVIPDSYKVFVHLLDANGQVVAQDDGAPMLWLHPTEKWRPGELVIDFHSLHIKPGVPAGEYTLQVGMYDEGSGARVKRVDAAGAPMADAIVISKVSLTK